MKLLDRTFPPLHNGETMILSRLGFLRLLNVVPLLLSGTGTARARTAASPMRKAGRRAEKADVGAGMQDGLTTGSSGPSDDKAGQPKAAGSAKSDTGAPWGGSR